MDTAKNALASQNQLFPANYILGTPPKIPPVWHIRFLPVEQYPRDTAKVAPSWHILPPPAKLFTQRAVAAPALRPRHAGRQFLVMAVLTMPVQQ